MSPRVAARGQRAGLERASARNTAGVAIAAAARRFVCFGLLGTLLPGVAVCLDAPRDFVARDFGATGDGRSLDTSALQRAIDAASGAGGGTVRLTAGTYISASIRLRSNVGLRLEHGAVLEAAADGYDPPEPNTWGDILKYQDFGHSHFHNALIWGEEVHDVSIEGPGMIRGTGLLRDAGGPEGSGDKTLSLKSCRNVLLRDVTIVHGGWFAILATGVDNLTIDDLTIDTNRDGIDVDSCRNVKITNCSVNSPRDDGICLKSSYALGRAQATENVTIQGCLLTGYDEGTLLDGTRRRSSVYTEGPTGRIKLGTESNGGFRNIAIANCAFDHSRGLAIESVDGGPVEDVSVVNVTMRDIVSAPIFVRLGRRMRGPAEASIGGMRRILIADVSASGVDSTQGVLVTGLPEHPIEDLLLSNVTVASEGGGTKGDAERVVPELERDYPEPSTFGKLPSWGLFVRHVRGLEVRGATLRCDLPDARPAVVLDSVEDSRIFNLKAPPDPFTFLLLRVKDFWLAESTPLPDRHLERAERDLF